MDPWQKMFSGFGNTVFTLISLKKDKSYCCLSLFSSVWFSPFGEMKCCVRLKNHCLQWRSSLPHIYCNWDVRSSETEVGHFITWLIPPWSYPFYYKFSILFTSSTVNTLSYTQQDVRRYQIFDFLYPIVNAAPEAMPFFGNQTNCLLLLMVLMLLFVFEGTYLFFLEFIFFCHTLHCL